MPPFRREVPVTNFNESDCWRTWFFNDCERCHLFGVSAGNLSRIEKYKIGTMIYLEDEPYSRVTNQHRICGPFIIVESKPNGAYRKIKVENGKIIIYEDENPSSGPWIDNPSATRTIKGRIFKYSQMASEWDFYPYRFSIQRADNFGFIFQ